MIAFVGNWKECPTPQQLEQYTHVFVSFAVTYRWIGEGVPVACSDTCQVSVDGPCRGQSTSSFIKAMHDAGKKVILSFGGATMGGDWNPRGTGCWESCFGREQSVVEQLTNIVTQQGYDGVDIDFEYFTDTREAEKFLTDVTLGLRASLPAGSLVTHAPMDRHIVPGDKYFDVLKSVAPAVDLILPQYYNGAIRPALDGFDGSGSSSGRPTAKAHYDTVVRDILGGDATRLVFGFCNGDCGGSGSNANADQAKTVMDQVNSYYPCNGGAYFWEAGYDSNGSWSSVVNQAIAPKAGCSA